MQGHVTDGDGEVKRASDLAYTYKSVSDSRGFSVGRVCECAQEYAHTFLRFCTSKNSCPHASVARVWGL